MATEVFTTETIRLLDEEEVELRPLPISKMRKFTRMWAEHMKAVRDKIEEQDNDGAPDFSEADLTDAQYDVFMKLCALGLESQLKGEKTEKQFLAYLEEALDERSIYRILRVTGGLTIGDENPNLTSPAESLGGPGMN